MRRALTDRVRLAAHPATAVPVKALMRASTQRAAADLRKVRQDIARVDSREILLARTIPRACFAFQPRIFRCGAPSTKHWRARSNVEINRPPESRIQFAGEDCR